MKYSYLETRSLRVNASFIVIAREKYYDIGLQIGKTENAFKNLWMWNALAFAPGVDLIKPFWHKFTHTVC
jgi:hypothetical protein